MTRSTRRNFRNTLAWGAATLALSAGPAWAQEQSKAEAADKPTEVTAGADIVVTAGKLEVNLQKLPMSVSAVSAEQLDNLNAMNFGDYFRTVPGLMLNVDNSGRLDFSLRGISDFNLVLPQFTTTVGQYVDEIPVTAAGAQLDARLVDVDRIEVLRGPQGTLYGEASLGGTIRTITKKPNLYSFSGTAEGRVSSTEGGGTNNQESLMINLPVVRGKLALRASFFDAEDSGYIDAIEFSDRSPYARLGMIRADSNSSHARGGRVMALFAPTDSIRILATAINVKSHKEGFSVYDPGIGDLETALYCPLNNQSPNPPAPGEPAPQRPACQQATVDSLVRLYNLTTDIGLGWATITSASSWAQLRNNTEFSLFKDSGFANPSDAVTSDTFTQEVRLVSSKDWSDRWNYVVGVFLNRRDALDVGILQAPGGAIPIADKIRETAIFGELGFKITDRLSVQVGGRATDLQIKHTLVSHIPLPPVPGSPPNPGPGPEVVTVNSTHDKPFTGRVVLDYQLNHDVLIYASAASGFRRGGFNPPGVPGFDIPVSYTPDETKSYELGWKLSFPSLGANLSGAVYHIDWKDMQSAGLACGSDPTCARGFSYTTNAADAVVDGLELEAGIDVSEGLRVQGSLALIDARLAEDYFENKATGVRHGLKGDRVPFVAPISGSISVNYRRALGGNGLKAFSSFNAQYQGKRNSDYNETLDNAGVFDTFATMAAYWTFGGQIGVENGKWRAALYVDNLFNERPVLYKQPKMFDAGGYYQVTARPRTVGLSLRHKF
jgi:outer membrane receptor protein involved in Fe transport